jgi:hypothetical protein
LGRRRWIVFEVKADGKALIRAEHKCNRVMARNALAHWAKYDGPRDLTTQEVAEAIRETLRREGKDAYTEPNDMFSEDWLWVEEHLKKVWKDPR